MIDPIKRMAELTPEKRKLVAQKLQKKLLSQQLQKKQAGSVAQAQILPQERKTNVFPLSFAQYRLWFLHQMEPQSAFYNVPLVLRLTGTLCVDALERSLAQVVQRHEVLRTTFHMQQEQPVQVVSPSLPIQIAVLDLQSLPAAQGTGQGPVGAGLAPALQLAEQEAQRPFDLTKGPLLRVSLLRMSVAEPTRMDSAVLLSGDKPLPLQPTAPQEHVLLLTMHHIVCDDWSMGVLMGEIITLYQAEINGEGSVDGRTGVDQGPHPAQPHHPRPLPELPIQYADYAIWQRQWLQGEVLDAQMAYWKKQLVNLSPLVLPTDHPRPAVQTYQGSTQSLLLPTSVFEQLLALSQQEHVTVFMTLLAAFQVLLARYTRQYDICVGTPIANRRQAEIEGLIGFFVNELVMRTNLSGNPTFQQVLQQVREVCLAAYAHQDIPFEKVVEELDPERDLSHSPLFQVALVLGRMGEPPFSSIEKGELAGITLTPLAVSETTSKFDLTLFLYETEQGLDCTFEYSTDLFEADTIRRWLNHWRTLLQGIVNNPQAHIWDLPLLTEAEREQLLGVWNVAETGQTIGTACPPQQDLCLHQIFEQQVLRTPDAVALALGEDQALTYAELNQQANRLAHYLQGLGVGPDNLIGICMERSIELVIGCLSVLKAGGAYVPLDPTLPKEQLALILAEIQATLLLTQEPLRERFKEGVTLLCLENAWELLAQQDTTNPRNHATPLNLAYAIYTSGSTGQPKGVQISHANVVHSTLARFNYYQEPVRHYLLLSPFFFDSSVAGLYWTLCQGGRLVLPAGDLSQVLDQLPSFIAQQHITHLLSIPSLYALLLTGGQEQHLSSLRTVIVAGENCPVDLVERHRAVLPQATLFNEYGPTEATVWSSVYRDQWQPLVSLVPIGRPITNVQIYLLQEAMYPAPIGVPAELCIGGLGVARGYLDQADLTAERFVPCPIRGSKPGERIYRTGDLARSLPDGTLEFLGRVDQQVKLRGYRIELGAIETRLRLHPAVRGAAVIVREDRPDDAHLVAYVTLDLLQALTTSPDMQAYLRAERIKHWQQMYDETYRQTTALTVQTFNIVGWNSSYTGLPIAAEEMQAWLEDTLTLVRASQPKSIWEIGCGTGLLLFPLASTCTHYYGTDFSASVLTGIRQQLVLIRNEKGHVPAVTLLQQPASDFSGFPEQQIDMVLLNSVVQYFPDGDYLRQVLDDALRRLAPGSKIIVGDVRSLPLLEAFHASVQLSRAPERLTREQLWQQVQQRLEQERELVLDPAFFWRWAQSTGRVRRVEVRLKRGRQQNELTQFRYQVVLHVGEPVTAAARNQQPLEEELNWSEQAMTRERLHQKLTTEQPYRLRLRQVPNARVEQAVQTLAWLKGEPGPETVGEWRTELLRTRACAGVEPEDLWEDAQLLGYHVTMSWGQHGTNGSYNVLLQRQDGELWEDAEEEILQDAKQGQAVVDWQRSTNQPLWGEAERLLVPYIRRYLQEHLPEYMVPTRLVVLKELPLRPNGKVDRRVLPAPEETLSKQKNAQDRPATPIEELVMGLWREVLGRGYVGMHDNFFELGGHSLLAVQLIVRVRTILGVELPVRVVFEAPTVACLAEQIEQAEI